MYMNGKHWQELDYNVASDYTFGGPEYYRTLLRQSIGLPNLLPGEKNENSKPVKRIKRRLGKVSDGGHMSGFLHQS
jgi:hypothetical protein